MLIRISIVCILVAFFAPFAKADSKENSEVTAKANVRDTYWEKIARFGDTKYLKVAKKRIDFELTQKKPSNFLLQTLKEMPGLVAKKRASRDVFTYLITKSPQSFLITEEFLTSLKQVSWKLSVDGARVTLVKILESYKSKFIQQKNSKAYLWATSACAKSHLRLGQFSEAKKMFEEFAHISKSTNDSNQIYLSKINIVGLYFSMGNISAADSILKSLDAAELKADPEKYVWTEILKNKVLYLKGKAGEAQKKSMNLLAYVADKKMSDYVSYIYLDISNYFRVIGNDSEATKYAEKASESYIGISQKLYMNINLSTNMLKNHIVQKKWMTAKSELKKLDALLLNKEIYSFHEPTRNILFSIISKKGKKSSKYSAELKELGEQFQSNSFEMVEVKFLINSLSN